MTRLRIFSYFLVALIAVVLTKSCDKEKRCPELIVKTDIDTLYEKGDSIPYAVEKRVPVPIKADTIKVPVDVDTAKILSDYYLARYYSDTFTDGKFKTIINQKVTKNAIDSQDVYFQDLRGQMIIRQTAFIQLPRKNELHGGILATIDSTYKVMPMLLFSHKKGFNVMAASNGKQHQIGATVKIRFK